MTLTPEQSAEVDELVERWRVLLGFQPWDEFEKAMLAEAAKRQLELGRRCGKTARALLHVLAIGVVTEKRTLFFGDAWNANTSYCYNMARDFIDKLGIKINPSRSSGRLRPPRGALVYFDHYEPRQRGAARLCSTCYKPGHRPEDHAGWEPE